MIHSAACDIANTGILSEDCPRCMELTLGELGTNTFTRVVGISRTEFDGLTDPSVNPHAPLAAVRLILRATSAYEVQETRRGTHAEYPRWSPS